MKIDERVRACALFLVFQELAAVPGMSLSFQLVSNGWETTGLRRSDFERALDEALELGSVSMVDAAGEPALLWHRAQLPPVANGNVYVENAMAQMTLVRARSRRRAGVFHGRRASDC